MAWAFEPSSNRMDSSAAEDLELVAAVQRGDEAALEQLVRRYHAPLCQFAERLLGDREAAGDVVQETFIRMIRALPRYRPQARFSTWLYTIATNLARDSARSRTVRAERLRPIEDVDHDAEVAEPPAAVADLALQRVQLSDIKRALGNLSSEHREVIVMHYYQGLSYKEIATATGCTVGTVGSRLHYAIRHLRRHLGAEDVE